MAFILIVVMLLLLAVLGGAVFYDLRQFHKTGITKKIKDKKLSWAAAGLLFIPFLILGIFTGIVSAVIAVLYLTAFLLLCNCILFIMKKFFKKQISNVFSCVAAFTFTAVCFISGWYCAHNINETHYSFETEKSMKTDSLRIVHIADSHLGITLDGDIFEKQINRIQKTNPDIVAVTGDFVDDASTKDDMIKACHALGSLETTYGVFFTFGNHDKGYMKEELDYTEDELRQQLENNNVIILEDEAFLADDSFYVIGRQDKSEKKRSEISELTENLDKSKYMIVLDHQPNDYSNEAESEVDMVLSGHTHGGHIFPAGIIGIISGANDKVYGTEKINNTDFVVTSGISGWSIPFKIGCISEYVVIDVKMK